MTKNIMKTVAITAITALMLTGCAENNEKNFNVNESVNNSIEESFTSTTSEVEELITSTTTTSTVESEPVETTSTSEIKEETEKPTASTTTSTTTSKPTEKPEVKPTSSSTSSTTVESKPIESKPEENPIETPTHTHKFSKATCEKPATCECGETKGNALGHNFTNATCNTLATCTTCGATKGTLANHNYNDGICTICGKNDPNYKAPHNCDIDGHDWEVTYTTTEPKWCREMHDVLDYGYDVTLAAKYLGVDGGEAARILYDNLEAMGVGSAIGSASIEVEVWGTETYEYKECKVCHDSISSVNVYTITPMGEWRYINGVNPRCTDSRLNLNILFYDPYNIPEVTIDNINLMWELMWV